VDGDPETKGRVMRCLMQQFSKFPHEVMDGIKIYLDDGEWVLIRPDEDAAVFHLAAEGHSLAAAQELIADYSGLVQNLVHTPCAPTGTELNAESGSLSGAQARP
jgi:phosphomannomutase